MPDPGRGNGQVQARVQDGKREAIAQGVVLGGSGVGADQVPVVVGGLKRQRRGVPERLQLGGNGPEQEPQARRVGHTAVQTQTGGVRRSASGCEGPGRGAGCKDAHPNRAPAVRQFGIGRVTGVVVRRRSGRLQIVRRPARRGRGARQTKQVSGGWWPKQQQDSTHTRGPANVVPVPRLRVVRRRWRRPVLASTVRRWQSEVPRLAGHGSRRLTPVEEQRILLAPDRDRGNLLVGRRVAASQPVAQLRFGTV